MARYRSLVLASLCLSALGWGGVLLVFAAALYAVLRRAEGGTAVWSHVAFVGCAATAVAILTAITFVGIVAYRAPAIDPETASVLYDAGGVANLMTAFPNGAPKDGTVIANVQRAVPQLAIQGERAARFDPQALTWLGSLSSFSTDAYILVVNARHPARDS